jgi:hypothetical protein
MEFMVKPVDSRGRVDPLLCSFMINWLSHYRRAGGVAQCFSTHLAHTESWVWFPALKRKEKQSANQQNPLQCYIKYCVPPLRLGKSSQMFVPKWTNGSFVHEWWQIISPSIEIKTTSHAAWSPPNWPFPYSIFLLACTWAGLQYHSVLSPAIVNRHLKLGSAFSFSVNCS